MEKKSDLDRRKFMEIGIYAITGSIAVVSGTALARFAIGPSLEKKPSKWIAVDLDEAIGDGDGFTRVVLAYQQKDGWLTTTARSLVYVKRVDENHLSAISATCTHLGCIVSWDEAQNRFKCPCHNGVFDANGEVVSGPPPAPLKRHRIKIEGGRVLLETAPIPFEGGLHESV